MCLSILTVLVYNAYGGLYLMLAPNGRDLADNLLVQLDLVCLQYKLIFLCGGTVV